MKKIECFSAVGREVPAKHPLAEAVKPMMLRRLPDATKATHLQEVSPGVFQARLFRYDRAKATFIQLGIYELDAAHCENFGGMK